MELMFRLKREENFFSEVACYRFLSNLGPNLTKGYFENPKATAEYLPLDMNLADSSAIRDGWLHSGDIASCSNEGVFTIIDRKKVLKEILL